MSLRLACLTLANPAGYVIDDPIAFAVMRQRGWQVHVRPWTAPTRWSDYDAVIIRTPWDYQYDHQRFLAVLASIEASGTPLRNPLAVVRWNLHKTYLRDVARAGVPTIPTLWSAALPDATTIAAAFEEFGGDELIIKPVIGANADHTHRVTRDNWPGLRARLAAVDVQWMLQPFLSGVCSNGEVSLFVFGGQVSHGIRKVPAAGDFRVQEEHGGRITRFNPQPDLCAAALRAVAAAPAPVLYARADFIADGAGVWRLIELELIEPSLYFRMHPLAARRFVDAVAEDLQATPRAR